MRVASGKWQVGPKQWREVIGWPKIGEAGLVGGGFSRLVGGWSHKIVGTEFESPCHTPILQYSATHPFYIHSTIQFKVTSLSLSPILPFNSNLRLNDQARKSFQIDH